MFVDIYDFLCEKLVLYSRPMSTPEVTSPRGDGNTASFRHAARGARARRLASTARDAIPSRQGLPYQALRDPREPCICGTLAGPARDLKSALPIER